jgi:hypothetical protein
MPVQRPRACAFACGYRVENYWADGGLRMKLLGLVGWEWELLCLVGWNGS